MHYKDDHTHTLQKQSFLCKAGALAYHMLMPQMSSVAAG